MAAPIMLWDYRPVKRSDDAGITIIKTILPTPNTVRPLYETYALRPGTLSHVPKLAYFCIRALSEVPEQLHLLGSSRLNFSKGDGGDNILRALLPNWKTSDFSLLGVDPRMWATLVQVYRNPPTLLASYPIDLADQHLRLLQQIPSTPDFALVTILDLQHCARLTDGNIVALKDLHNLCALDVSGTGITAHGIKALARVLLFNDIDKKRGPWALRILRMRNCSQINKEVIGYLQQFPLLCAVDLRGTKCIVEDAEFPFHQTNDRRLFDLPLTDAIKNLAKSHEEILSHKKPFVLSIKEHWTGQVNTGSMFSTPQPAPISSKHNSFVVLPPSRGVSRTGRPVPPPIQFGNTDILDIRERNVEREERLEQRAERPRRENGDWYPHFSNGHDGEEYNSYDDEEGLADSEEGSDEESSDEENLTDEEYGFESDGDFSLLQSILGESTMASASTEGFYKQRPHTSPVRRPGSHAQNSVHDMTLVKAPPPWYILDTVTPGTSEAPHSSSKKRKLEEIKLHNKGKEKASVHDWQVALARRRKPALFEKTADSTLINGRHRSLSPSPTSTLRYAEDMLRPARALRPISNVRAPPHPGMTGRPRLKLEPDIVSSRNAIKPRSSSSVPSVSRAEGFTSISSRDPSSLKARNSSLEEGFQAQAAKKTRVHTSISIKGPKLLKNSSEYEVLKKKTPANKPRSMAARESTPRRASGGFNWRGWGKGSCS